MIIDCLVMAGGRGSRLGSPLKPLVPVCGEPMVARVIRALALSGACRRIVVAASPLVAAALPAAVQGVDYELYVMGLGYVDDLRLALGYLEPPVLVVPADLPGLVPSLVRTIVKRALAVDAAVVDVEGAKGAVGLSVHKTREGGRWAVIRVEGLPSDVDTPMDLREAETSCQQAA